MSYIKQTWQNGEVVTAEKLNHMESGIGSCVHMIPITVTTGDNEITITLGETWQTIYDIAATGVLCVVYGQSQIEDAVGYIYEFVSQISPSITSNTFGTMPYVVSTFASTYTCDVADGYPSMTPVTTAEPITAETGGSSIGTF